jgi:FtsP/CotA-like multicopper oxidase with cupredoxin domain
MSFSRRHFLRTLSAVALGPLPRIAHADHAATPTNAAGCGNEATAALLVPRERGFMGRLVVDDRPVTLRAAPIPEKAALPAGLSQAYFATVDGRDYVNPTLVMRPGQRARIDLVNAIAEPTIVHWHGFALDTRNDGAGGTLANPGERYAYDFPVRNRSGLYWYHPHPHGLAGGQAYRGMFGLIEVQDPDEERLRAALDLVPGASELPLAIQDRRAGSDYAATDIDRMHGFLGDHVLVNGTPCPQLDVATRIYRFRVLNASNARTYRLAWRTADGKPLPFTLIGNDGGLLPAPITCNEAFLASAERLDVLLDLSDASIGDSITLETTSFDPMHMETPAGTSPAPPEAVDHAAMGHAMPPADEGTSIDHAAMGHAAPASDPHAGHAGHGGAFPEGSPRVLLALSVRTKIAYGAKVPARLSSLTPIDTSHATERPLRLGFAKGRWRINDRVFAMGETPIEVKRDSIEVWLIRNYFNSMPHAMHLHGFAFEVLQRETSPEAIAALKIDDRGRLATDAGRKDTVLVWPGESVRIAVDFSCPFPGNQTYVFHCHNLEHEDAGMMLGVKVS